MIKSLLVANRGEIACRIFRTAKKMGIRTIAVYSEADALAPHVEMADERYAIGPSPASESYLVIDKIIEACKATGAEAVHPGYGFLSERAEFAERLASEGIAFLGPNPHAIHAMGDKIESKRTAAEAGVSTVPGSDGALDSPEEAAETAAKIGYPVMLKASAGGGGKGMRIAYNHQEALEGFVSAQNESRSSFGDDRVFVEKFIENPRHIEIQVLGDKHGKVIHLGERECSIQRRNQKVLEEAPSPLLDPETRAKMGEQAVLLAQAVGYDSAGTVEFVAGQDKSFYFLEMNTRLQVEHPVTELVTGVDLVEWMIRIGSGEPLTLEQEDIVLSGSAIESRLYAEDPSRNFLPSTGRLTRLQFPAACDDPKATVRIDTGVIEGSEISLFYDPMIAKLVTYAPKREAAIAVMAEALDECVIEGIRPNIAFLASLMKHPRWLSGELSTAIIGDDYPDGFTAGAPEGSDLQEFAAVAAFIDDFSNRRRQQISGSSKPYTFPAKRIASFSHKVALAVEIAPMAGPKRKIRVGTEPTDLAAASGAETAAWRELEVVCDWYPGQALWRGTIDGAARSFRLRTLTNGFEISRADFALEVRVLTRREAELSVLMPEIVAADQSKFCLCPMPGLIKSIHVEVGQEVKGGELLCVVEAMKMENALRAEVNGKVSKIHAAPGDSLAVDAVILEFE